ncbi:MAG: FAD-dependent oxidoreductase [Lachnospiraceae bacterium]|nr:FAD-dependent oxidoreductase [Lachnospiraceae bacterium]
MESLWRRQEKGNAEKLKQDNFRGKDSHWDVIVVGAGMAGILTAYYLKEQGKRVLVLEADRLASGQTERTTAKITSQHGLKYSKLIKTVGMKKAELYDKANEEAIREYERLIEVNRIECEFQRLPAYLYTLKNPEVLEEEVRAAEALGMDAVFTKETELPFSVEGAVCFQNQAQFSPLKFIHSIAAELEILEHTKVIAVKGRRVITKDRVMTAEKIVLATHYPIKNVPGFYFLRQHQERSYVLALSGCSKINGMYYGIDQDGLSFRQAGDFLLVGGGSHRTGENKKGGSYDFLMQAAKKYFPDCREEARWSAQDCMPHDKIPFIGKFSMFTPHLYVATGFQKWGMTSSMIAAMVLRDELCGKENPYGALFSPQYRDEEGKLHKISARCPHMGCELTWNPDEKSWDCPCHGSRFDVDGKLLDNPAKKDAGK